MWYTRHYFFLIICIYIKKSSVACNRMLVNTSNFSVYIKDIDLKITTRSGIVIIRRFTFWETYFRVNKPTYLTPPSRGCVTSTDRYKMSGDKICKIFKRDKKTDKIVCQSDIFRWKSLAYVLFRNLLQNCYSFCFGGGLSVFNNFRVHMKLHFYGIERLRPKHMFY